MFRVKKRNHLLWRYLKPFQSPLLQMSLLISLLISIFHGKILIITNHSDRLSSVSKTCWTCFPLWDQFFYAMRWYSTFLSFPLWGQFCKVRDLSFSPTLFERKPKEWDCLVMALLKAFSLYCSHMWTLCRRKCFPPTVF